MQTAKVAITCQNVAIHDLQEGDEVLCHGAVFRLKNRKEWANHYGTDPADGTVVSWETDLVWHPDFCKAPDAEPYYPLPLSWARGYGLQSNRLMSWAKIVERPALPNEVK